MLSIGHLGLSSLEPTRHIAHAPVIHCPIYYSRRGAPALSDSSHVPCRRRAQHLPFCTLAHTNEGSWTWVAGFDLPARDEIKRA